MESVLRLGCGAGNAGATQASRRQNILACMGPSMQPNLGGIFLSYQARLPQFGLRANVELCACPKDNRAEVSMTQPTVRDMLQVKVPSTPFLIVSTPAEGPVDNSAPRRRHKRPHSVLHQNSTRERQCELKTTCNKILEMHLAYDSNHHFLRLSMRTSALCR